MTELLDNFVSKKLEYTKHAKKGLEDIYHHKVSKREELFNDIEIIKSYIESTDTEAFEHKSTSDAVMRMLESIL